MVTILMMTMPEKVNKFPTTASYFNTGHSHKPSKHQLSTSNMASVLFYLSICMSL